MTTPSHHLTAAGELVALGVMCGVIFVLAACMLIWSYLPPRRNRMKG